MREGGGENKGERGWAGNSGGKGGARKDGRAKP